MGDPRYFHHNPYYDPYGFCDAQLSFPGYIDFGADHPEWGSFRRVELAKTVKEEEQQQPEKGKVATKNGSSDEMPPHPGYILSDMTPTERDPRCTSKTKLACFWPVYVANFRCENRTNEFESVKEYFAWKGLHVRWWYRKTDEYFHDFQSKAGLYDMLVYFVSEQDANRAIQLCHRETYKGYPMNVFPGREPVYFDPTRTLQAQKMRSGRMFSELFFEKHVKLYARRRVDVTCTVKFDNRNGAMEFASRADVEEAQKSVKRFAFEPISEQLQKQRFLEQDLLEEIEAHLVYNPGALEVDKDDRYVRLLLQNQRPKVDPNPKGEVRPLRGGPSPKMQRKMVVQKKAKQRKYIRKALSAGEKPNYYLAKSKFAKQRFDQMVAKEKKGFHRKFDF